MRACNAVEFKGTKVEWKDRLLCAYTDGKSSSKSTSF